MVQYVTWITTETLDCEPTANVILCLTTFTIDAQLVKVFPMTCPTQTAYSFTYDDADLPSGYLDTHDPLTDKDVKGVICEDCLTQWVRDLIDFAGELEIIDDADTSVLIPASGPLHFSGGASITTTATAGTIEHALELSADSENQAEFGTDGNLYVPAVPRALDGWIEVTDDAWSYLSSGSITVPAGALLRYSIGDRIRIVQGGVPAYFYISSLTDTVLTVTAGADYFVLNQAIQEAYYSKVENPVGFPLVFSYTTTIHGFSVLPTVNAFFRMRGREVNVLFETDVAGTSNNVIFNVTAPLIAAGGATQTWFCFGQGGDNGIYQADVFAQITAATNQIDLYLDGGTATWTAAGLKSANFNLHYLV